MKTHTTAAALPQSLRATYNLLQAAFPQAIDPEAYLPLLALLAEELSDRNLAEVVACAFSMDYERVFNTMMGWARFGHLFDYDETTETVSLPAEEPAAAAT